MGSADGNAACLMGIRVGWSWDHKKLLDCAPLERPGQGGGCLSRRDRPVLMAWRLLGDTPREGLHGGQLGATAQKVHSGCCPGGPPRADGCAH